MATASRVPGEAHKLSLFVWLQASAGIQRARFGSKKLAHSSQDRLTLDKRLVRLIEIQVKSYAGAKADETPRSFNIEKREVQITEVIDRWYQVESKPEWPRADYFKVRGEDGRAYLLKHDLESDAWFLGKSW